MTLESPKYIVVGPIVKAAMDEAVRTPVLREALRQRDQLQKVLRDPPAR